MAREVDPSVPVCTFIIPFYNEGSRILNVLSTVRKIPLPVEIICVDDGSTDDGFDVIKHAYPQVTTIRNSKNLGKSAAIGRGVALARGEYVFLLDADLQNLSVSELTSAIELMMEKPQIDMIILRRKFDPFYSKVLRGDVLVSGERILKTKDLLNIMKKNIHAYEIEPAINRFMMKQGAHVGWFLHSGTNVPKIKKIGFFPGIHQELKYFRSVLAYHGLRDYLQTLIVFCHDDVHLKKDEISFKHIQYLRHMFLDSIRWDLNPLNQSLRYKKRLQNILLRTKKQTHLLKELIRDF